MTSTTLPRNTFLPKLRTDSLPTGAITVQDKVIIDDTNCTWNYKKLENITFTNTFEVSSINIKSGLVFINCTFKKGIKFIKIESDLKISENNPFNHSVFFSKCNGSSILFSECPNILRGVVIENESSFDSIHFQKSHLSEIKIKNSKIDKLLEISNLKSNEIKLDNNTLKKNLNVTSFKGDVILISNTFGDRVKFWNIETNRSFTLNKNNFNDEFEIKASRIKGFYSHQDTFLRKAKLENGDTSGQGIKAYLNEIHIADANFVEGFEFDGMGERLSKITLPLSLNTKGVLKIHNWKIKEALITGINQNLKLLFSIIGFKRLIIGPFSNFGVLNFDGVMALDLDFKTSNDPDSSFIIHHSTLGSTRFSEFDFDSFDFISVSFTSFEDIEASNVKWFSDAKLKIDGAFPSNDLAFRRKREIYRQIKQALRSRGNQIESLIFQSREMKAYRDELKANPKNYNWKDRLIMTVNMSNNYGLSWWKPTWIIIVVTVFFYILMLPLFSDLIAYGLPSSFENVSIILSEFWNNFEVFWQLFNPARKFTATYGQIDNGWLHFLDLIHRVILGVFIYQIIRGFRRLK